jgi:hypothetical protein
MSGGFLVYLTLFLTITSNIVGSGAASDDHSSYYSSDEDVSNSLLHRSPKVTNDDLVAFEAVRRIRRLSNRILANELGLSEDEAARHIKKSGELKDISAGATVSGICLRTSGSTSLFCPWGNIILEELPSDELAHNYFNKLKQSLGLKFHSLVCEHPRDLEEHRKVIHIYKEDGTKTGISPADVFGDVGLERPCTFSCLNQYVGTGNVVFHRSLTQLDGSSKDRSTMNCASFYNVVKIKKGSSKGWNQDLNIPIETDTEDDCCWNEDSVIAHFYEAQKAKDQIKRAWKRLAATGSISIEPLPKAKRSVLPVFAVEPDLK